MNATDAADAAREHNRYATADAASGEPAHGHRMAAIRERLTAAGYTVKVDGTRITAVTR